MVESHANAKRTVFQAALIVALAFVPLAGCWNAPFLAYDDADHIWQNPNVVGNPSFLDFFKKPRETYTWQPLTTMSYRLDFLVFNSHPSDPLENWAPGVRIMTAVYHAAAALIVWRILLFLSFAPLEALFGAVVFAIHPLQCETVCWASERKTALAGMFGFAAVWTYLTGENKLWRVPVTCVLYILALLCKPSALGLMPIFALTEIFGGADRIRAGTPMLPIGASLTRALHGALRLAPLAVISATMSLIVLKLFSFTLLPVAGNSIFVVLLSDVEVLARYLFNFLVPVRLSFNYYVEPLLSPLDTRFAVYGLSLAGVVLLAVWLAPNRRRALFGWTWFFAALAPASNIAGSHTLMQDRYLYLCIPGGSIAVIEATAGIVQRMNVTGVRFRTIAFGYVAALLVFSVMRGSLFSNTIELFRDSIEKYPQSAHARYGMWIACRSAASVLAAGQAQGKGDPDDEKRIAALHAKAKESAIAFVDRCPDNVRQLNYVELAVSAGDYCLQDNEVSEAQRYFTLAANPPLAYLNTSPQIKSEALLYLAEFQFRDRNIEKAYQLCEEAVQSSPGYIKAHYIRGCAALRLADAVRAADAARAQALEKLARPDLEIIPADSEFYSAAQAVLKRPKQ